MKRIKMNFWNQAIPDQIMKARNIVEQMTGNSNFATPTPSLAVMTEAIDKLEAAYEAALDGGKTRKAAMNREAERLIELVVQLAAYVQLESQGNEAIILSSGFDVRAAASASRAPETPLEIKRVSSTREGEVDLKWAPVKHARAYILESNDNPSDEKGWTFVDVSCKAGYTASDLNSLSIKWFRVAAVGIKGRSDFSLPIKAFVR